MCKLNLDPFSSNNFEDFHQVELEKKSNSSQKKSNLTEEIHSITAGIQSRELCQAPICASAFIPLTGVVGESFSFSTLQMQRRLHPDSNVRLEATYRHSHLLLRLNERRHRGRLTEFFIPV